MMERLKEIKQKLTYIILAADEIIEELKNLEDKK